MATKSDSTIESVSSNGKLPEGWRMVRFGDVVHDVKESERNPLEAGLERYIGLEHIEPENLHIKEWGDLTQDEVSFTKRFREGQVLFGKRRAYQRKVALAEFDGICSSDILTFEPKDDALIPELLPFIVQSDAFFNHALGTSSGSLSPRTRWSQLKDFEFPLAPQDKQRPVAETLQAAVDCAAALERVRESARIARNASHRELTFASFRVADLPNVLPDGWKVYSLKEACEIANHLRKPINAKDRSEMQGDYPYYGPTGALDYLNEYRAEGEYTLIGEDGDHFLKYLDWEMTQLTSGKFNVNNHAHLLQGRLCSTKWLFHYFKHRNIRAFLARQGAGRLKLNKASLEAIPIAVPPPNEESRIIEILDQHDNCLSSADKHLQSQRELLVRLREDMLWGAGEHADVE